MSLSVVDEAAHWADELMEAEWRGRKDREGVVRYRLARKIGVPESYLYRLQYKQREMNDVRGSVYRALMHGRRLYGLVCERVEETATRIDREAQEIEAGNAPMERNQAALAGVVAPTKRPQETQGRD
jgi:hypothetical protein